MMTCAEHTTEETLRPWQEYRAMVHRETQQRCDECGRWYFESERSGGDGDGR